MREGWRLVPIAGLMEPIETWDPRKEPDCNFNYIDVSSVSRKTLTVTEHSRVVGARAPSRARRKVKSGDVIFATIRPTLKRVAEVPEELNGAVCSTGFFVFRANSEILGRFMFYWLLGGQFSESMAALQRGAAYPAVSDGDVKEQLVAVPTLSEQKSIVTILDEAFGGIDTAIANTEKNLANARELFESYSNSVFDDAPADWTVANLSDICSIKHGFAFKSEFFTSEGAYVVLTPGSFFEKGGFRNQGIKTKYYDGDIPEGYILQEGDFLFAMTEQAAGLLGSSLIVPQSGRYLHNQRLGLVQIRNGVDWCNDFFFHQFNTQKFRSAVQLSASGAKVRHTSPTKLGEILIKYPPLKLDQERVAVKLNEIRAEVQRLDAIYQQKLSALTELKQSLLQKAFSGELTADAVVEVERVYNYEVSA